MAWLQPVVRLSLRITTALLLLAHLLAAYALVAFGWRAGGYALYGLASYGYLGLSGLAAMLFVLTYARDDEWAEAIRIVLGPALALVVVGAWTGTTTNGAEYATWDAITGDQVPLQALWHLGFAGLGSLLALVLGWPRLLMAWALTHTLIFAAGLLVFGHWAARLRPLGVSDVVVQSRRSAASAGAAGVCAGRAGVGVAAWAKVDFSQARSPADLAGLPARGAVQCRRGPALAEPGGAAPRRPGAAVGL